MMGIKSRTVALIYRFFSVVVVFFGLLLSSGILEGKMEYNLFIYFTYQSNIWCLIFFVFLIIETLKDLKNKGRIGFSTVSPLIRGEVMISIMLTHLVYHNILAPHKFKMNPNFKCSLIYWLQDVLVHYVTPLLTVLDYLLFCKKNSFLSFHPFVWLSLPIIYIIVVFIIAEYIPAIPYKDSRYPYFFLDIDLLGTKNVIKYIVGLTFGLIVFAYMLVFFDWFINFEQKKSNILGNEKMGKLNVD
ncbi:hypothetical protein M9Y10_015900 [Tritrichomonas musculus]|uniref:Pr6Pr family membrane protein n=1 Tax=Tritrichomonas musculus TaxID=1915356 RepID=A0ABR2I7R9_9EUKA